MITIHAAREQKLDPREVFRYLDAEKSAAARCMTAIMAKRDQDEDGMSWVEVSFEKTFGKRFFAYVFVRHEEYGVVIDDITYLRNGFEYDEDDEFVKGITFGDLRPAIEEVALLV